MGNKTEFNLRTVPMLFGVKEAKVIRDWGADMEGDVEVIM